jgi:hypothetical protein
MTSQNLLEINVDHLDVNGSEQILNGGLVRALANDIEMPLQRHT